MRICHAYLFHSIKYAGGTSDLIYKIVKEQVSVGHEVTVLVGDYKFDSELADLTPEAKFAIFKSWFDEQGISLMPGLINWCIKDLRYFDVVHMHAFRTFQNLILYLGCKYHGIPYVIDAHGSTPYYKRKPLIKRVFDFVIGKKMLREAKVMVAETAIGVDEYLNINPSLNRSKITILSPPFDTDEFSVLPDKGEFRLKFNIPTDVKVISFLGRIHEIKGNDFLIRGFAEFLRRGTKAILVLVGPDDGHMAACKKLVEDFNISKNVIFAGFLASQYKNQALVDSDIVVQLSRQEQGAWAPIEAVLCGTPIIVTRHTGSGEDVKRLNAGQLIDIDDVSGLADMFAYMFSNYASVKEQTLKAKKFIEANLSMSARIGEYTSLYIDQ